MTKVELVAAIAEKAEVSKKDADAVLKALTEVVTEDLKAGGKVQLPGLGTFETTEVGERRGIIQMGNRKGEEYVIAAHVAPKMKISKTLKDAVK